MVRTEPLNTRIAVDMAPRTDKSVRRQPFFIGSRVLTPRTSARQEPYAAILLPAAAFHEVVVGDRNPDKHARIVGAAHRLIVHCPQPPVLNGLWIAGAATSNISIRPQLPFSWGCRERGLVTPAFTARIACLDDAENRQPSRFYPATRPTDGATAPVRGTFRNSDHIQTETMLLSSSFWRCQSCKNPNMLVSGLDFKPSPPYLSLRSLTEKNRLPSTSAGR